MHAQSKQFEQVGTATVDPPLPVGTFRFSTLTRDIATLGGGTILATLFNIALIFLVPRLVSVEDYGYWRLFTLYIAYAGFLHLGLADGALLRWAGKPLDDFHKDFVPSLKFLVYEHALIIVPATLLARVVLGPELRFVTISVLMFAVLMNAITVLQYSLQSARVFLPVAVSTVGPVGIFLLLVFAFELFKVPHFRTLICLYFIGWLMALVYLLCQLKPHLAKSPTSSTWHIGRMYISVGWPVLLANTGLNLAQSADRLAVSWTASIQDFGRYSLGASSTITVVLAMLLAIYRVFFPHLAAASHEQRRDVYASTSRVLFLSWALLLPYYFLLEVFIRRVLSQYLDSLPIAYILLPGTIFIGEILVLHTSFAYLNGRQKKFLWATIGALGFSFVATLSTAMLTHSLRLVATVEVATLGLWWIYNEWSLHDITGRSAKEWGLAFSIFMWVIGSYWLAFRLTHNLTLRVAVYYAVVSVPVGRYGLKEMGLAWRLLSESTLRVLHPTEAKVIMEKS